MLGGYPFGAAPLGGGGEPLFVSGALNAPGSASAAFDAAYRASAELQAAGSAAFVPIPQTLFDADLLAHGFASVDFRAERLSGSDLTAAGFAAAAFITQAWAQSAFAAAGIGTFSPVGASKRWARFDALGTSTFTPDGGPTTTAEMLAYGNSLATFGGAGGSSGALRAAGRTAFTPIGARKVGVTWTSLGSSLYKPVAVAPGQDEALFDAKGRSSFDVHAEADAASSPNWLGSSAFTPSGQSVKRAQFAARGQSWAAFLSKSWGQGRLVVRGQSNATFQTSNALYVIADLTAAAGSAAVFQTAVRHVGAFSASGLATVVMPTLARAVLLSRLTAKGDSLVRFDSRSSGEPMYAIGRSSMRVDGETVTNVVFDAAGQATLVWVPGNSWVRNMPLAYDVVTRPYEERGVIRPAEAREVDWA